MPTSLLRSVRWLPLLLLLASSAWAQKPQASMDLHASAGFPTGASVGVRLRLAPVLSVEASGGVIPFAWTYSVGLNLHTAPNFGLDPAFSLVAGRFEKNGETWLTTSLMFGVLSLHKFSLHSTFRGGVSALIDGAGHVYPAPALEAGLAWGF